MAETRSILVKSFSELELGTAPRILEIGSGRGSFSRILRAAFPDAFIVGYERITRFKAHTNEALSEIRYEDVCKSEYEEEQERFDAACFGSTNIFFWWHFNCHNQEEFRGLLKAVHFYIRPGGYFVTVFKLSDFENEAQKNYIDSQILFHLLDEPGVDLTDPIINNEHIIDLAAQSLQKLGNYSITFEKYRNTKKLEIKKSCLEWIEQGKWENGERAVSEETVQKAKQIDEVTRQYGQEIGFYGVFKARKG